jgi:hypothetical protein
MKYEEKIVPTTAAIFIMDFSEHRPLLELSKEAIFEEKIKDNGESLDSNVRANYVTTYFAHLSNDKFIPLKTLYSENAAVATSGMEDVSLNLRDAFFILESNKIHENKTLNSWCHLLENTKEQI